jgi:NAD(P)-dependent dehydrogenase (short-subunit alcohol dehydrogenase family)
MTGKVVVITGATSGIGQVAAETLAALGSTIIQIARDRVRGQAAMKRLRQIAPNVPHAIHYADLSEIAQVKRVAVEIASGKFRIDMLINNAGAIFGSRELTQDGLERTFALNHMAYFGLTLGLLERLKASAPSRIINTASDAHESATLDFNDLQSAGTYGKQDLRELLRYGGPGYKVYARSKLCNVLFTRELAKRLEGTGVTVNCFHPGFVATRFAERGGGLISFSMRIAKRFARPAAEGAKTLVFLASSPDVISINGQYFHDNRSVSLSAPGLDDAAAERLWLESSKILGLFSSPLPV